MNMNTEALRFVLGIKIRQLRLDQNLSLKQLSESSGLSLSYISEIEKGKKYPKPEKLFQLAKALNVSFDDLVSLNLEQNDQSISALLNSPLLNVLPLKEFGISLSEIFELANNTPSKAGAFVQTLLEIGRNYDMQVEHFLLASLRSYQKMHLNYFPKLEKQAETFRKSHLKSSELSSSFLEKVLFNDFDVLVTYRDLSFNENLKSLRSIWIEDKHQKIIINPKLSESQRVFELCKEVYYRIQKIKQRPSSSTWMKVESFDQVYNNFKASYFAGALLLPEKPLIADIKQFMKLKKWNSEKLESIIKSYSTTLEMFLYRLSQLIPHHFGLNQMHYMRIQNDPQTDKYQLTKELNTTDVFVPRGIGPHEHHCRRWASIQLLRTLADKQNSGKSPGMLISAQKSYFSDENEVFFNIALARPMSIDQNKNSGMTLGFRITDEFKHKAGFWNDETIPIVAVNESCERCPIDDCESRAAPAHILDAQIQNKEKERDLQMFIEEEKKDF